ncbi:MAG: hypothetical protein ABR972_15870 [Acidimicrobiales bacterium]
MKDLSPEEAEILRRSIAMLPAQAPSGLSRERALAILAQLVRALRECHEEEPPPVRTWALSGTTPKEAPQPCCTLDLISAGSALMSASLTNSGRNSR